MRQWKNVQKNDAMTAGAAYQDSGFLVTNQFGGYVEPRTFKDFYNEILKASSLGHYTFHALRHTFATRAMEQGMDGKTLSILLGHYSVAFTLDTYTHVLDSQKQEEMKVMEEFFSIPSVSQTQSYVVVVTPIPNSFLLNPVDFENMSIKVDNLQYGIQHLQTAKEPFSSGEIMSFPSRLSRYSANVALSFCIFSSDISKAISVTSSYFSAIPR